MVLKLSEGLGEMLVVEFAGMYAGTRNWTNFQMIKIDLITKINHIPIIYTEIWKLEIVIPLLDI